MESNYEFSPSIRASVEKLTQEQKEFFYQEYMRRKKDPVLMTVLAVLFPIQLFLLGKTGLGVAFWLTGGGCGIWTITEWFLTSGRTREYNNELATQIIQEIKALHQ